MKNWLKEKTSLLLKWYKENTALLIVSFSIFFVPLIGTVPIGLGDVWYIQYLGLLSVFCFGIAFVVFRTNCFLSLFALLAWFSAIFIANQHPRAILALFQVELSILAIHWVSKLNSRQRWNVLKTVFALFILQAVWVILQFFNLDPIFNHFKHPEIDDTVGFSGSHNQIGLFFAQTAPLVLAICPYLLVFTAVGLFGSTTTTAFVGTVVSSLTYIYLTSRKKREMITLFSILFIMVGMVFFTKFERLNSGVIRERSHLTANTIADVEKGWVIMRGDGKRQDGYIVKKVTCNRWFGYGIGNFIRISPWTQSGYISNMTTTNKHLHHRYSHAHNDIIEVFFEFGRTGFFIIMLLILDFLYGFIRSRKTKILNVTFCCVLAHLICAQGIFTVHTAVSAMILIVMFGLYLGEYKEINSEQRTKSGKTRKVPWLVSWKT